MQPARRSVTPLQTKLSFWKGHDRLQYWRQQREVRILRSSSKHQWQTADDRCNTPPIQLFISRYLSWPGVSPRSSQQSSIQLYSPCSMLYPTRQTAQRRGEERSGGTVELNRKENTKLTVESDIKCLPVRTTEKKVYPPKIAPTSTFNLRIIKIFSENQNSSPKSLPDLWPVFTVTMRAIFLSVLLRC